MLNPGGVVPQGGYFLPEDASSGGCFLKEGCFLGGVPGGDPPGMATAAGSTCPTGMHSCLKVLILVICLLTFPLLQP